GELSASAAHRRGPAEFPHHRPCDEAQGDRCGFLPGAVSARASTDEGRDDEGRVMNAGAQRNGGGDARELTGRTVFVCLVGFFAVVAAANAVMIRAAVSTFGGLETESSYQAGLVFAREEAQARSQDALHWRGGPRAPPLPPPPTPAA